MSKNKSFSSEISQRYALALYELSIENKQIEETISDVNSFIKVFNSNNDLKYFIKNPTISSEKQKIVFENILNQMMSLMLYLYYE